MTDMFTKARVVKLLADWKRRHGRDISMTELAAEGFAEVIVDDLVRSGHLVKYQVTAKGGRRENRFKLPLDEKPLKNR
jgi:hypothetical protein